MPTKLRFPKYDLDSSVQVAQALHQGAGGEASGNELAAFLGYRSTNNGAFLSRVAAAKMFGLIEGHASRFQVTDLALSILQPDYPETEQGARLVAFESVPLFRAFLKEYEGQPLPGETGMKNALTGKFGVPGANTTMALNRLLESADQAGLFRTTGSRTKMIRPTVRDVPTVSRPDEPEAGAERPSPLTTTALPKLIEGALEAVPWDGRMTSEEIDEWIAFFRSAMVIHFRSPS